MTENLDLFGDPSDDMLRTADISPDGLYRYSLTRIWGGPGNHKFLPWIMLNPSTADHSIDDPTIRRCIGFARAFGYSGIRVYNLYAFRATNPADLLTAADPVGPRNDAVLRDVLINAHRIGVPVIAAWGVNAKPDRVAKIAGYSYADQLHCLGVTKAGQPKHPLYLPKTAELRRWPA
jgi:hypothetical protein